MVANCDVYCRFHHYVIGNLVVLIRFQSFLLSEVVLREYMVNMPLPFKKVLVQ